MMVKTMSDSKRIKEKIHFYVSGLTGADQNIYYFYIFFKKKEDF